MSLLRTALKKSLASANTSAIQKRHIFKWLAQNFNFPDSKRRKEIGPDRACAEWLLRCGASSIGWKDFPGLIYDFNKLPLQENEEEHYLLEQVDASGADITYLGFSHIEGCNHIQKIKFHKNRYLEDNCLEALHLLKESLEHLEIGSCRKITDRGLASLPLLSNLKTLVLEDLPSVRDKDSVYEKLISGLPNCDINYKDIVKDQIQGG